MVLPADCAGLGTATRIPACSRLGNGDARRRSQANPRFVELDAIARAGRGRATCPASGTLPVMFDESLARLEEAGWGAANRAFCAAGDPLILLSGT
jgi:hypothetical protein